MRNVAFAYPGAEEPVVRGVSFTSLPGQTTAIVGSTGSGKTTLISLVPRLFDATEGTVLVDGVDVRDLQPEVLWDRVGLVPQKPYLFSGTVASNLQYGKPDATEEQMWEALEIAQARDFVAAMPGGLEASISQGGTNVSGGQRQRLAIARAVVRRPEIYLFDDSFSALDLATDARLRAALAPHLANSTVLVVAQRISTILTADQILVLDDGVPVGLGPHAELLEHLPHLRGDRRVADRRTGRSMSDTDGKVPTNGLDQRRSHERQGRTATRRSALRPASASGFGSGRMPSAGIPMEKSLNFGPSVKRLLRRMGPDRGCSASVFVLAVIGVTLVVFGPKVLGHATDLIVSGLLRRRQHRLRGSCTRRLRSRSACTSGSAVLVWLQGFILAGVVQRTMFRLRADVEAQAQRPPTRATSTGMPAATCSAESRTTSTTSRRASSSRSASCSRRASRSSGVTIMMITISPLLALVAIITIPVSLFTIKRIAKLRAASVHRAVAAHRHV